MELIQIIRNLLGLAENELESIGDLTDEQLAEVEAAGEARFDELAESNGTADEAEAVVVAVEAVREEAERRLGEAESNVARIAELGERLRPVASDPDPDADPETPDPEADPEGDPNSDPETPDPETPDPAEPPAERAPTRVAASSLPMPGHSAPPPNRATRRAAAKVKITAAGDVPGFSSGNDMPAEKIGEAFLAKIEAIGAGGGRPTNGRYPVARLQLAEIPEERDLRGRTPEEVTAKIERVMAAVRDVELEELAAAASMDTLLAAAEDWCAPFEVSYDLFEDPGTTRRPLIDSLPGFSGGARRGGVRYMSSPVLADLDDFQDGVAGDAIGIRTAAQKNVDKTCFEVDCGDELTAEVRAVYRCMNVSNWQNMSYPERTRRLWALIAIAAARVAERAVYADMVAGSSITTVPGDQTGLGATRDYFAALDLVTAGLQHRHRSEGRVYQAVIPTYLRRMLRTDFLRQEPGDERDRVTDAEIDAEFRTRGMVPVDYMDAGFAPIVGGETGNYPATVRTLIYPAGTWARLTGATLDFGTEIRDATLIVQNKVRAFIEQFEGVAKVGNDSLALDMALCLSGKTSVATDFDAGCGS